MTRRAATAALRDPAAQGCGPLQLVSKEAFYDEATLPFALHGAGVLRLEPERGFTRELLAATPDEAAVIADCPDAPGWLVPEAIVADWMARHVRCAPLDDILLAHPLYEHLTAVDEAGHSRGPSGLVQWVPGIPTVAMLREPEFLPDDRRSPRLLRDRDAYAEAVAGLLDALAAAFPLQEITVPIRWGGD